MYTAKQLVRRSHGGGVYTFSYTIDLSGIVKRFTERGMHKAVYEYVYGYEYGQHGVANNGIEPTLKGSAAHDEGSSRQEERWNGRRSCAG